MTLPLDSIRNDDRAAELAAFLEVTDIGSLATTTAGEPFVTIVFMVYAKGKLFFKSRTGSAHSTHLAAQPHASIGVFLPGSTYDAKYGAQLRGVARRIRDTLTMTEAVSLYSTRFAGSGAKLPSIEALCSDDTASTFYEFVVEQFKIIDEDKATNRTMLTYAPLHT